MPTTEKNLYRSLKTEEFPGAFQIDDVAVAGLLYPRFAATEYMDKKTGERRISQADVTIKAVEGAEPEVQSGGGTSLFDVPGWFTTLEWREFIIPAATEYPANLVIVASKKKKKNFTKTTSGFHHQIEPKNPMTVDAFKGALDTFARNAVVRSNQLAKGGK